MSIVTQLIEKPHKAILGALALSILCTLVGFWLSKEEIGDNEARVNELAQRVELLEKRTVSIEKKVKPTAIEQTITRYFDKQAEQAYASLEENYLAAATDVQGDDHVYGNPKAEYTLIEFSDYQCPYCKSFHANPKEAVARANGELNWSMKHFPLQFHEPAASNQAVAAECAARVGNNRHFWMMTDMLFAEGSANSPSDFVRMAKTLRLDTEAFSACLNQPEAAQKVRSDLAFAKGAGVNGTPAVFMLHAKSGQVLQIPAGANPEQLEASLRRLKSMVAETEHVQKTALN